MVKRMKKILFLIHDLGPGGAEKVLVNLVNNMDQIKYDVTVQTLFDVGINKKFLAEHVHYKYCFKRMVRGNSHLMKLFSPEMLHKFLIKEKYDVEVAYLEGPCARIISGCPFDETIKLAWIHIEQHTPERAAASFRNISEAEKCYNRFEQINCVSEYVKEDFCNCLNISVPTQVVYNTNESEQIIQKSKERIDMSFKNAHDIVLVGVGKLLKSKGFDRILKIVKRLQEENYNVGIYILGVGEEEGRLKKFIEKNRLTDHVRMLGYQKNPYKYIANSDLFVCASWREGFSTATTEALIVGTPVCAVDVSGMKEMLGENNEYGVVVPNDDEKLYIAIKELISNKEKLKKYRLKALERGKKFSTTETVSEVEKILDGEY